MDSARPLPPPGTAVVDLGGQRPARRYLARAADHVLVVVTGRVEVAIGPAAARRLGPGAAAVCPRGVAWSVRSEPGGARVVVVAVPGGSEQAVAGVLRDPGADDAALVALAADGGLELLLAPAVG